MVKVGALRFQLLDFAHHGVNIDRFFLLECIDIAGNIEVVIVVDDLLHRGTMAVLLNLLALTVGIDNLADMFGAQFVLRLNLLKLFARVDEQNVVTFLMTRIQVGMLVP